MDFEQPSGLIFRDDLLEILESERNLLASLVRMGRGLHSPEVAKAFERCRADSENQIDRLCFILASVELRSDRGCTKKSPDADGLEPIGGSVVLDAVLASAIQAAHRYSSARYATLRDRAARLGLSDFAVILSQAVDEKEAAIERLEPLTELRAADFHRDEAISDGERTVVISNDNVPAAPRPLVDKVAAQMTNVRQQRSKEGGTRQA